MLAPWPELRSSAAEASARRCFPDCCGQGVRPRTWWSPRRTPTGRRPGRDLLGTDDFGRRRRRECHLHRRRSQACRRGVGDRRHRRSRRARRELQRRTGFHHRRGGGQHGLLRDRSFPRGRRSSASCPTLPSSSVEASARLRAGASRRREQLKEVAAIFDAVGGVLTVPESQLDAVTAVSGSGPAYFFLMVEALVDAGVAAGLPGGGHRSGGSDDGRFGGDVAGTPRRAARGRRRRDWFGDGYQPGAVARHRDVARWHHRRWAAGTRAGWPARGGGRGGGRRKNTL